MYPDATFVQFWQIHQASLPGVSDDEHFMGFYINIHDPGGRSMMDGQFGGHSGMMRFQGRQRFRFHYQGDDLDATTPEDRMMVRFC